MRSAVVFLPFSRMRLISWVTSGFWYTGSGWICRRTAGPLRGIGLLAALLGAVAGTALLAVLDAGGVERAADDRVAHTTEVLRAAAPHEHDRVLLQVVALAGDVAGDLDAGGEPHA